jgi:hypothetical protein
MPIEYTQHQFSNLGFIQVKFSDQELQPLFDEIKEIEINNFKTATPHNTGLAGNIEHEFELKTSQLYLDRLIRPFCHEYNKIYGYTDTIGILTEHLPFVLDTVWVNFQKKYEFNPVHSHQGVYSFVLWIDIPYDILAEKSAPQSINSRSNVPGHFQFVFNNTLGKIKTHSIPVDHTYNNTMVFFPSELMHIVYPFTTSDNYRISVSGNFKLDSKHSLV